VDFLVNREWAAIGTIIFNFMLNLGGVHQNEMLI
jgi:hypothetical protein